jgi:hypothetical protein
MMLSVRSMRFPHYILAGLTNQHQRRGIMLSLPLVFLAYSVAGFITGVVIHSFRSAIINLASAGSPIAAKFDEYMDIGCASRLRWRRNLLSFVVYDYRLFVLFPR